MSNIDLAMPYSFEMNGAIITLEALANNILKVAIGNREKTYCTSYVNEAKKTERIENDSQYFNKLTDYLKINENNDLIINNKNGNSLLRIISSSLQIEPNIKIFLELIGQQHIYGLGEGGQQFDRLGIARRFWNFQANKAQGADIAVPFMISQLGYAIFFDNSAMSRLEHGDANEGGTILEYSSITGALDIYIFIGEMRNILKSYAELIGKATMPPKWALGYLQSTRFFESTEEIIDLAENFKKNHIKCDAIIFLSTYGTALGWNDSVGTLEFQKEIFAEPDKIINNLHERGFRVLIHEYPVLHQKSPLYKDAQERGYLLDHYYPKINDPKRQGVNFKEGQAFIDFSKAEVREWWWNAHRSLVEKGVDGWWLDGGEGPPEQVILAAGPSGLVHNRFDLWRQLAFANGEARDRPNIRPFLLCRSGGPGMSSLGAIPWSGDINTTFETMDTQIKMGLNLGMSGIPHWGTDAGGFFCVGPDQGELFVRWLQFAAFCSLFRAHGHVWRRHVPWAFGEEITNICREIIELRYSLLPFTYSLVRQAHDNGLPTMRPLVLNYPEDPHVWDLGTEYLWGDDILVAPVTRRGATYWSVYLPDEIWYNYWTGERYVGPGGITVNSPLNQIPLFIRSGAIIPLVDPDKYSNDTCPDEIKLLIYPAIDNSFMLYEDDGITNKYLENKYAETKISCQKTDYEIIIKISEPTGFSEIIPLKRSFNLKIWLEKKPMKIFVNNPPLTEVKSDNFSWYHDSKYFLYVQGITGAAEIKINI